MAEQERRHGLKRGKQLNPMEVINLGSQMQDSLMYGHHQNDLLLLTLLDLTKCNKAQKNETANHFKVWK